MAVSSLPRQRHSPSGWSGMHSDNGGERLSSYLSANEDFIASTPARSPSQLSSRSKSPFDLRRSAGGSASPTSYGAVGGAHRATGSLSAAWSKLRGKGGKGSPSSNTPTSPTATPAASEASAPASTPTGRSDTFVATRQPTPDRHAFPSMSDENVPLAPASQVHRTQARPSSRPKSREKSLYPPPALSTGTSGSSFRGRVPSLRRRNSSGKVLSDASQEAVTGVMRRQDGKTSDVPISQPDNPETQSALSKSARQRAVEKTQDGIGRRHGGTGSSASSSGLSRFFSTRGKKSQAGTAGTSKTGIGRSSVDAQTIFSSMPPTKPDSPPLAIISSEWTDPAGGHHYAQSGSDRYYSTGTGSEHDPKPRPKEQDATTPADRGQGNGFSFPSRPTETSEQVQVDAYGAEQPRSATSIKSRHAATRSVPLSMNSDSPLSPSRQPISSSTDSSMTATATATDQTGAKSKGFGTHQGRSLSLNKLASFLSGSTSAPTTGTGKGGPSPRSDSVRGDPVASQDKTSSRRPFASAVAQQAQVSATTPPLETGARSLSRRPSLRARLKIPRLNSTSQVARPTTPEIESWKQKAQTGSLSPRPAHGRRASVDAATALRHDSSPVKITRSRSMVRRKPPPEFNLEELTSAASTPPRTSIEPLQRAAFSRPAAKRGAKADLDSSSQRSSPLSVDPAPKLVPVPTAVTSVDASTSAESSTSSSKQRGSFERPSTAAAAEDQNLAATDSGDTGLVTHPTAAAVYAAPPHPVALKVAHAETAKIPVGTSQNARAVPDPSHEGAASTLGTAPGLLIVPGSVKAGSISSGRDRRAGSIADMSNDSERPWSLISAGEADTPLLRLRKLIVDTNSAGDCEDDNNSLFFRPLPRADAETQSESGDGSSLLGLHGADSGERETIATPPLSQHAQMRSVDQVGLLDSRLESISLHSVVESDDGAAEGTRNVSPSTVRSDLRHENASVHSSGSSTLMPRHFFANHARAVAASLSSMTSHKPRAEALSEHRRSSSRDDSVDHSHDHDSLAPLPHEDTDGRRPSLTQQLDGPSNMAGNQRRSSVASRNTVSSGQFSEGVLSEDALSALEAEVGQARRAEVVAVGRGRVSEWVGDSSRMIARHEGPTLSRSGSMRRIGGSKPDVAASQPKAANCDAHQERARQMELGHQLGERLQRLELEREPTPEQADAGSIRDIPDELSSEGPARESIERAPPLESTEQAPAAALTVQPMPLVNVQSSPFDFNTIAEQQKQSKGARLSAFHDRKLPAHTGDAQGPSSMSAPFRFQDEAIRLGRAPSKRVRRSANEAKSSSEAVMVTREQPAARITPSPTAPDREALAAELAPDQPVARLGPEEDPRRAGRQSSLRDPRVESLAMHGMRRTRSEASDGNRTGDAGTSGIPLSAAALAASSSTWGAAGSGLSLDSALGSLASGPSSGVNAECDRSESIRGGHHVDSSRQLPANLTTEEAILAKQKERQERERRQRKREERKQLEQQRRYALKKKSDPLLATRLALMGLLPGTETPPMSSNKLSHAGLDEGSQHQRRSPKSRPPPVRIESQSLAVPSPSRRTFASDQDQALLEPTSAKGIGRVSSATASSGHSHDLQRYLSAPSSRHASFVGSVMSFHTAESGSSNEGHIDDARGIATTAVTRTSAPTSAGVDATSHGPEEGGPARPPTSASLKTMNSIASSLTVDFEFPIPPQRLREQLSDDGTLLSRAGLRESAWDSPVDFATLSAYRQLHRSPSDMLGQWQETSRDQASYAAHLHRSSLSPGKEKAPRRAKSLGYHDPRLSPSHTVLDEAGRQCDDGRGDGRGLGIEGAFEDATQTSTRNRQPRSAQPGSYAGPLDSDATPRRLPKSPRRALAS